MPEKDAAADAQVPRQRAGAAPPDGLPRWWEEPLSPFANVDNSIHGFTEMRCHGVSGPLPGSVLQFPEQMVAQVTGNADSGFWRRWRAGGPSRDVPDERHIEAFCWGGLTSRASVQALWLLVLPFSLVNLAHWMLPPYVRGGSKWAAKLAVVLLRVLALSFTLTLLLAGAEITMDLGAWQCGAVPACRGKLAPFSLIAREGNRAGLRLVTGAAVLALVLVLLWRAGLTRFRPLIAGEQAPSPAVRRFRPGQGKAPVLSEPSFWAADKSTRWLRCLHAVAWCAGLGAILAGALHTAARPGTTAARAGGWMLAADLIAVAAVFVLVLLPERFGRGGAGFTSTRGIRWVSALGILLLAGNIGVTVGYLPNSADPGSTRLPWLQGAFGRLVLGQVVVLILLTVCVIWLAVQAREHDQERAAGYRPMLGGLLAVVFSCLGWLLGVVFSAGLGLWVAGRLGQAVSRQQPSAHGGPLQLLVPPVYAWIDAAAVAAAAVVLAGAVIVLARMFRQTGSTARKIENEDPNLPPESIRTWPNSPTAGEKKAKARSAARLSVLAQSIESVPRIIAACCLVTAGITGAAIWRYPSISGKTDSWFPQAGWIASVPTAGAWIATTGTAAVLALAYAAYRNRNTRRLVGILWDVTTFWPRANHPLTPACSAERAVPQLADRIAGLTTADRDQLVLSAHSQGTVLGAAAILRLKRQDAARLGQVALLTYGCPLRRLYARAFPAYFSFDVLEQVRLDVGKRWLNLWASTDPIGGTVIPAGYVLPVTGPGDAEVSEHIPRVDWRMVPDPLTLGVDPRTGEPVAVCDHSGYLTRPEYPVAIDELHESIGAAPASQQVPQGSAAEAGPPQGSAAEDGPPQGSAAEAGAAEAGAAEVTAPPDPG